MFSAYRPISIFGQSDIVACPQRTLGNNGSSTFEDFLDGSECYRRTLISHIMLLIGLYQKTDGYRINF